MPAHHPLYKKDEFMNFVKHIKEVGDIVGNSTELEKCISLLEKARGSEVSKWDVEDIKGFVAHNKKIDKGDVK